MDSRCIRSEGIFLITSKNLIIFMSLVSLFVLNSIGAKVPIIALGIALMEWAYLIICCLIKRYYTAFVAMIVFITISMETTTFVAEIVTDDLVVYSIYSLPIIRSFPCYMLILFLTCALYTKYKKHYYANIHKYKSLKKVLSFFPFMFLSAALTGIVVYFLNDNGVADTTWYLRKYIEFVIKIITLMALIFATAIIVISDKKKKSELENIIELLLVSCAFATTITLLFGWTGYYGTKGRLILMPLSASLCAVLIWLADFKEKNKLFYMLLGIVFTLEIVFFAGSQMGSKFYLLPALSIILIIANNIKKGKIHILLGIVIIILLVIISGGLSLNITLDSYNNWKVNQLLQMFQFKGKSLETWYLHLNNSPKVRVDEFMSILCEYLKKPAYAIFGKGAAGTITHLWGDTIWNIKGSGAFSDYEIDSNIYMFMHESLNVIFIRHGILGLVFLITTMISLAKRLLKNPWALIGMIWLFFYWGTYRSWWIGAVAMVLALV